MSKQDVQKEMQELEASNRTTVGELRRALEGYSDATEVNFGCTLDAVPLMFYRVKRRGENLVQIELNEASLEISTTN